MEARMRGRIAKYRSSASLPAPAHSAPASSIACETRIFEGSRFTVCAFDARKHQLHLMWAIPMAWRCAASRAGRNSSDPMAPFCGFAMNAGMY